MKIHVISKAFDFCYGHRVHNQMLDPELAVDTCLVCRHLHGHQGRVIVKLSAEELKDGMVTDFKHLGWFKQLIDQHFDHKMILDINDPVASDLFPRLFTLRRAKQLVDEVIVKGVSVKIVAPWLYNSEESPAMLEIYEGLVFVDFVPTSENLSKFLFDIIEAKMGRIVGFSVDSVEFQETPKTSAIYG